MLICSWIPGLNPICLWCGFLLRYCWIWFDSILLRTFTSLFIRDFGLYFPCHVLIWPWYQDNAGLIEWVWEYSHLLSFLDEFEKGCHSFFYKCLVEWLKPYGLGLFFVGFPSPYLLLIYSDFPFFSWFSPGKPANTGYTISWHIIFHSSLLSFFVFFVYGL